jgi:hypothetical protein
MARHASREEAVGAAFALVEVVVTAGGGQIVPPNIVVVSTRKGAKGMKKDQKRCLRRPAAVMNNSSVMEKVESSNKEFVASAGRNFKLCTQPPKDHFKKVLEAACSHHPYPVRHKLRDCTVMKRFMSSDTSADGNELARDLWAKGTTLRDAKVATIVG